MREWPVMFANLADIIKIPLAILAGIVLATGLLLLFYEGVRLPLIGQVVDGRVQNAVKDATAAQTAIYNARIEKMVSATELAAANATLARERALRRMADDAAFEADKRAADAKRGEEAKAIEIERLRKEADQDAELSRPNQRDREWQSRH